MHDGVRRAIYEAWVHDHAQELYAFAFRLCGNAANAEDLVQETFYHAWRSLDGLRGPEKGRAWLFQILRHRHSHRRREEARCVRLEVSLEEAEHVPLPAGEGVLDVLSRRESLQKALDTLEDHYKEPFLMVFLQGLSCQEAADALDIPLGTVLSRIHRARALLRKHLHGSDMTLGRSDRLPANGEGNDGGSLPRRIRLGGDS
jgi:RNA polymerase sigma-70 factor (ECF subfamily)